jgi:hypothetical protein
LSKSLQSTTNPRAGPKQSGSCAFCKAWQNAPPTRVIRDKSMLCSHQQAGLTLDFHDFFGRIAMEAREEASSKRLASQSLVLK